MTSNTDGGDDKVVQFPLTPGERQALRRQKQESVRQRLINCFVDETGNGEQALYCAADGTAFADLIIGGVRQTWPVRSRKFRAEYIRYLTRKWRQLAEEEEAPRDNLLALTVKPALKRSAVNRDRRFRDASDRLVDGAPRPRARRR